MSQALDLSRLAPAQLVDALLPTMFAASAPANVIAEFEDALSSFHPVGLRAMARACAADLTDVVRTIRLPTLVMTGEDDTRAGLGVATELHEAIPGSELVVLPGAGHVCNIDAAEPFNATLRRFLEAHPPR